MKAKLSAQHRRCPAGSGTSVSLFGRAVDGTDDDDWREGGRRLSCWAPGRADVARSFLTTTLGSGRLRTETDAELQEGMPVLWFPPSPLVQLPVQGQERGRRAAGPRPAPQRLPCGSLSLPARAPPPRL